MASDEQISIQIKILNWPVVIIKADEDNLVLRDYGGAELQVTTKNGKLTYERIW